MISLDFQEKIIEVTGQPYFEYIQNKSNNYPAVKDIRKNLGVENTSFLLTYASEPITETYQTSDHTSPLGYTEESNLRHLLKSLEKISKPITIIVKLHPKESSEKFAFLKKEKFSHTVKVIKDFPVGNLIYASDLVCGMSSMFLIEAMLMRKAVISIQIGLTGTNPWVFDQQGICPSVRSSDELKRSIDYFVVEKKMNSYTMPATHGVIKKIINVIEGQLWGN
jgi:predicted glycosyltransferase